MNNLRRFFAIVLMISLSITFANAQKTGKPNKINGLAPKHVLANTNSLKAEVSPNKKPLSQLLGPKAVYDLLFSYPLTYPMGTGVETDGSYLYISRWNSAYFYRYSLTGTLVDSFTVGTAANIRDLAYDGQYFYGSAASNLIYQMDFTSHTLVSTITGPTALIVRHIAYDPVNDAFWCGNWDDAFSLVSKTGTLLNTIPAATHTQTSAYGSAYDPYSAGGPYLWIYNQDGNGNTLAQISIATGAPTGQTFDVTTVVPTTSGIAGGCFISADIIPNTAVIGGLIQNETIWGLELKELSVAHNDMGVSALVSPTSATVLTSSDILTVTVNNFDTIDHDSIPVICIVDGGTPVIDTVFAVVSGASSVSFSFTQPFNFSIPGHVYDLVIYTGYTGDGDNSNDTLEASITNLWDVASVSFDEAPIVGPGSLDPKASVENLGTIAATFDVTMVIQGGYSSTKTITALAPGASQQVTFDPWSAINGTYNVTVYTTLLADSAHGNDTIHSSIQVQNLYKVYCYMAYDPASLIPEGPATTFLQTPNMITSLADQTGQNYIGAGTWGLFNRWYGIATTENNLVSIDTLTGARTIIGATGNDFSGIAYDFSTNKLFGVAYDGTESKLYTISTVNGTSTLIGTCGTQLLINLACDLTGNLYSVDLTNDTLYHVSKTNGSLSPIGYIGFDASYAQDLEFDHYTSTLYMAAYNNTASAGELRIVNIVNGSTTLVGQFANASEITGFAIPYHAVPPTADAGVGTILSPENACGLDNEAITITIQNTGANAINNFPVSYTINGGAPVTETITTSIASGNNLNYTFTTPANLTSPGVYNLVAYTSLTGDAFASNDTAYNTVENVANATTPYSMGFEPSEIFSGWAIENTNGDANTWAIVSTGGNTAPYVAKYVYNSASSANDWLISKCIQLDATKTYELSYWYKAQSASYPESMSAYIGTTPVSTSLTTLLNDLPSITATTYTNAVVNFTVPTTGVYYIGWQCSSAADMYNLYLDDINLSDVTGIDDISETSGISVYPNPATNVLNMKSGIEMKNVKIYNSFGQLVVSNDIKALSYKCNTESLSEGLYFIYIETAEGVSVSKITINK